MTSSGFRRLALAVGAAWTLAVLGLYLAVIGSQDGSPAAWFVGLLVVSAGALVVAAVRDGRATLVVAAVLLAVGALAGALSIGVLLVPPAILAGVFAARSQRRPTSVA